MSKPDVLTHALIEKGNWHDCPEVTLEQRIALVEAPPLQELHTIGQEKPIWFTDASAIVINGKRCVKYAAINLDKEIIQGQLDHGSAQHAKLHAIYQVLKQYEDSP